MARAQGFVDPISLFARLRGFAQPSEVMVPIELLRAGAVLQARGLINSQVIQHNLDWIWPYWVEQQFDPRSESFVPRAFSLTHINLTHRNWTAVGISDFTPTPIVDPRGLVMPFFDSWSLDAWIMSEVGGELIPSRLSSASQHMVMEGNLKVVTEGEEKGFALESCVEEVLEEGAPACRVTLSAQAESNSWLVVALRPYNPEGISFIRKITLLPGGEGWEINGEHHVYFRFLPDRYLFSHYQEGDVYHKILRSSNPPQQQIKCSVGMATGAALFRVQRAVARKVRVLVPLDEAGSSRGKTKTVITAPELWRKSIEGCCALNSPYDRDSYLYKSSVRTLILHTPDQAYAGPYTYKRFWFRDMGFIVYALLCVGLYERARKILNHSLSRQSASGYFVSQEGEWDSNGVVLWSMKQYCAITGANPDPTWLRPIKKACRWIRRKRLSAEGGEPHAGLLPAGFSAEHLGPNDYYYWDDFWSVAGLRAGAYLLNRLGTQKDAEVFSAEADSLLHAIERSLQASAERIGSSAMPASPYRRLDSGAIGSIVAGYPLKLWDPKDSRVCETVEHLMKHCLVEGGFFHDIAHSGINAYLTLHMAQVLLRSGDERFLKLMDAIASLASPTGQWPEAIHPRIRTGCMGDGQHVWASAEWILMARNCLVREEEDSSLLVILSGVTELWYKPPSLFSFGPAPTIYGPISISVSSRENRLAVRWTAQWRGKEPRIQVRLPGHPPVEATPGSDSIEVPLGRYPG
ncbi:MAG: hypothetical protein ACOC6B_04535 [Thermodesulfobacteriota bacterium]